MATNKIKIKLLTGACGYESTRPDGSIQRGVKTSLDGPFFCPAAQALRMIRSGQAEALESVPKSFSTSETSTSSGLETFTLKELRAMADKEGLAHNSHTTKAELIEALEELDNA